MHVHVCMYAHTYIRTYVCTYAPTYVYMLTCMHACIVIYTYIYIYIFFFFFYFFTTNLVCGSWGRWTNCPNTCGVSNKQRYRYCEKQGGNIFIEADKQPCDVSPPCPSDVSSNKAVPNVVSSTPSNRTTAIPQSKMNCFLCFWLFVFHYCTCYKQNQVLYIIPKHFIQ